MANPGPNCSQLAVRTDWSTYARKLLDQTHGDVQLLDQCKLEVCGALWGEGNGDISGIGVGEDARVHHDEPCREVSDALQAECSASLETPG